jgi:hypothetical protein
VEVKWAQSTIPGYSRKALIFKQWHRRFVSQLELVVCISTAKVPFPEDFDLSRFVSQPLCISGTITNTSM